MPQFLKDILTREYPGNPNAVYGVMNKIGAMHGNVETPKGAAMQAQQDRKLLHPSMVAHGLKVKAAHAHLSATRPGFAKMAAGPRMKAVQAHIRKMR